MSARVRPCFGRGGRRKRRRNRVVPPRGAWGHWPRSRAWFKESQAAVIAKLQDVFAREFDDEFCRPATPPSSGVARLLDESDLEGPVGLYDAQGNLKAVMSQRVFWLLRERGGKSS